MAQLLYLYLAVLIAVVLIDGISGNDSEFGRIVNFDSFDHFMVSKTETYFFQTFQKVRKFI